MAERARLFSNALLDTALIEREREALFGKDFAATWSPLPCIRQLCGRAGRPGRRPFSRRDGWRYVGPLCALRLSPTAGEDFNGRSFPGRGRDRRRRPISQGIGEGESRSDAALQWRALADGRLELGLDGKRTVVVVHAQGDQLGPFTEAGSTQITVVDQLAHAGDITGFHEGGRLTAPMPGKVVSFTVRLATRSRPAAGRDGGHEDEHTIAAPGDGGVVLELLYVPGDQVSEGELLRIEVAA